MCIEANTMTAIVEDEDKEAGSEVKYSSDRLSSTGQMVDT